VCDESSTVGLCEQGKSLRIAVMIFTTLVNTHTHTHKETDSFCLVMLLAQSAELEVNRMSMKLA